MINSTTTNANGCDRDVSVVDGEKNVVDIHDINFIDDLYINKKKKGRGSYVNNISDERTLIYGKDLLKYDLSNQETMDHYYSPNNWLTCTCLPQSRKQLINDDIYNLGIINLCRLPSIKLQSDFEYVWNKWIHRHHPNINNTVLSHENVKKAIDLSIEVYHKDEDKRDVISCNYEMQATNIISKMASSFSIIVIRFTGWFLFKLLRRLFNSVIVHKGQMAVLQRISKRNKPIILLPTHKSHLDYIILSFLMFNYDIRLPHVAAGDNLTLPLFRFLMKSLGGFFIRRKMDGEQQKDYVYRAVLRSYMNELLKMNEVVEFYIEGGRSRSGKVLCPKTGLLSIVVDACLQGVVEDCYIVPISLCYEKLIEGDFVHEQMGGRKEKETFTSALVGVFKSLHRCHGNVRVDVGQPFSLKEFIGNYNARLNNDDDDDDDYYSGQERNLMKNNSNSSNDNNDKNIIIDINKNDDDNDENGGGDDRSLVHKLAYHIFHDQCRIHSVSSTHLLSFVLLISNRKSMKLEDCVKKFGEYKEYILSQGHCMSFSGDDNDVVLHAVHLLGLHLLQFIGDNSGGVISINSSTETFIELAYYANNVIMILSTQCVIANSVCMVKQLENHGGGGGGGDCADFIVQFDKNEMLEEALLMTSLLQYEFIFASPCCNAETSLEQMFNSMISSGFFHKPHEEAYDEETEQKQLSIKMYERMSKYLDGEEGEEDACEEKIVADIYQVDKSKLKQLCELKTALSPIIECYCVVAMNFISLVGADVIESEFLKNVRRDLFKRLSNKQSLYGESVSMETMTNALRTYEQLNIVKRYEQGNLKLIGLVYDHANHKVLCNFIQHIQSFLL